MTDIADAPLTANGIDRTANGAAAAGTKVDDIARKLHEAIDRLTVHANKAEQRIHDATDSLDSLLRKSRDGAGTKAEEVSGSVSDYVNEHPVAALGIAFGAGLLLATLLRRNS